MNVTSSTYLCTSIHDPKQVQNFVIQMDTNMFLLVCLSKLNVVSTHKRLTCLKIGNGVAMVGSTVNVVLTKKYGCYLMITNNMTFVSKSNGQSN